MEITFVTFITLAIILAAIVYALGVILCACYKHDHPNEK